MGPTQVLFTPLSLDDPVAKTRYWGSTLVDADAQTIIDTLATRWNIEIFFEDIKDVLGVDHYQLMQANAILRFWTLMFCLAGFLDEHRARLQAERPEEHFPLGDARRSFRADHQRNLLA